jgi:nucleoside-diphosphate-sugar epimerase
MKVLLTGANGFVGSHILDRLVRQQIPTVALLRPNSERAFLAGQLAQVEIRTARFDDAAALDAALEGITHVIHCAGATKALNTAGFFAANQGVTRDLVAAVNRRAPNIQRFLLVSSLAAAGPGTPMTPRTENHSPAPVSDYGRSKLAAEEEVVRSCQADWSIIRPPAVYGPRDREFLRLFKAAQSHLRPTFGGGRQALTLVFVHDLAAVIVAALTHPRASRQVFFAGATEVVTTAELATAVAKALDAWTLPLPLPNIVLWLACQWAELVTRISGKANVLSAQKWAELKAPGWVCDVSKLQRELGCGCPTGLTEGFARTKEWYVQHNWL